MTSTAFSSRLFTQFKCSTFLLVGVLAGISCTSSTPEHRDYETLFSVNGVERSVYDFESRYVEYLIATGKNDTYAERYAFINELIDEILLAQSAEDKDYHLTEKHKAAVTYEQQKSMIDHYFVDQMELEIEPLTDDEIRLAYAKRQRKVYVRQLYSKNQDDLEAALSSLEAGKNFIDVANEFYQTPTYDSLAGYLGPISYFGVDDVVAEAAYSTNQGSYTPIIRSRLGFHILYVDYIEFPALLAEDEYQYRKSGVESQLRLRRQRLVSNNYVYNLMSSLAVQTNNEAILELKDVIEGLDGSVISEQAMMPESGETIWTDERIQLLSSSFSHERELASYVLAGERVSFTFADYLKWLPFLSFQESKLRLGASIGRGMRNEVLYTFATQENYAQDSRVIQDVAQRSIEYLSDYNQYRMAQEAFMDTQLVDVPSSFRDRLIKDKERIMEAEYWMISAQNLQEARAIKEEIQASTSPQNFTQYVKVENRTISPSNGLFSLIEKSVLNQPTVGYSAQEGWLVLNVSKRNISIVSERTSVEDVQQAYRVYASIQSEIDRLRATSEITIDTTLFDSIYKLWDSAKDPFQDPAKDFSE